MNWSVEFIPPGSFPDNSSGMNSALQFEGRFACQPSSSQARFKAAPSGLSNARRQWW
jgi:hypothetical protein